MRRPLPTLSAVILLGCLLGVLFAGCKRAPEAPAPPPKTPTLRINVVSTLAGALEPCGCVKDMLGGVDHAAAVMSRDGALSTLLVAAGPTLFMDPTLDKDARAQTLWKAEAIAESLKSMGLSAWAPGANDWAAGAPELERLAHKSGASLLAANLSGATAKASSTRLVEAGSLKVGLAGVSDPRWSGALPEGVKSKDVEASLVDAEKALRAQGAQVRIALLAVSRGDAMRLAEKLQGFQIFVVGKPFDRGDANDGPIPPALVGKSLVVQAPNHLQRVAVVDLFVRGDDFEFRDGSGLADAERRSSLTSRIAELEQRIEVASLPDSGVRPEDLSARKKDLERLQSELAGLSSPQAPSHGSFFRYSLLDVRESAGTESAVAAKVRDYYRKVNEHNRVAFADRKPPPVAPEGRGYVGMKKCAKCHAEELAFWKTTAHAKAYDVLAREDKQFNLDCVGCHVTGYEKPGGSTVTHVEGLKDNQCENCHGPGSLHAESPGQEGSIIAKPERSFCASECHHPPHVQADWSVDAAWKKIIGPGHGMKKASK